MTTVIRWSVGKEGTMKTRLDKPPFRAYFYWFEDEKLVRSADFDRDELKEEIRNRCAASEDVEPFEAALHDLR